MFPKAKLLKESLCCMCKRNPSIWEIGIRPQGLNYLFLSIRVRDHIERMIALKTRPYRGRDHIEVAMEKHFKCSEFFSDTHNIHNSWMPWKKPKSYFPKVISSHKEVLRHIIIWSLTLTILLSPLVCTLVHCNVCCSSSSIYCSSMRFWPIFSDLVTFVRWKITIFSGPGIYGENMVR